MFRQAEICTPSSGKTTKYVHLKAPFQVPQCQLLTKLAKAGEIWLLAEVLGLKLLRSFHDYIGKCWQGLNVSYQA
jgi:hypothetical protein